MEVHTEVVEANAKNGNMTDLKRDGDDHIGIDDAKQKGHIEQAVGQVGDKGKDKLLGEDVTAQVNIEQEDACTSDDEEATYVETMDFVSDHGDEELRNVRENVKATYMKRKSNEVDYSGEESEDEVYGVEFGDAYEDVQIPHIESDYLSSDDPGSYDGNEEDSNEGEIKIRRKSHKKKYDPRCKVPAWDVGMVFECKEEFQDALAKYALDSGFEIRLVKNETYRVTARCMDGCPWKLSTTRDKASMMYVLRTYTPEHRCTKTHKSNVVNSKFLVKLLRNRILGQTEIKLKAIKELMKHDYGHNVTMGMCRIVKRKVLRAASGAFVAQFKRLYDYKEELLLSNPGSTCEIDVQPRKVGDPAIFRRLYICFAACKTGWRAGCRKIFGVDGCFLKGTCKGQILSAIGKNANNQMFPIAWAVVEVENEESWRWFLELLKNDLNLKDGDTFTVVSDKQKGLMNLVGKVHPKAVLPKAEHRMCAFHVFMNFQKRWRGHDLRQQFWRCAKSSYVQDVEVQLKKLDWLAPGCVSDLLKHDPIETWCRAFAKNNPLCDAVDNNMCETFNGWILEARNKPIVSMLEEIRLKVMSRFVEQRKSLHKWVRDYGPNIMEKIEKNKSLALQCSLVWNGEDGYEVVEGEDKHTVFLKKKKCTCRSWDLTGIPCQHGICAIYHAKKSLEMEISPVYHKDIFFLAYMESLQPVRGELFWPRSNMEQLYPPEARKMPSRPKKVRRKDRDEPKKFCQTNPPTYRMSKKGQAQRCRNCGKSGHNKKTCKEPFYSQPEAASKGHEKQSSAQLDTQASQFRLNQNVHLGDICGTASEPNRLPNDGVFAAEFEATNVVLTEVVATEDDPGSPWKELVHEGYREANKKGKGKKKGKGTRDCKTNMAEKSVALDQVLENKFSGLSVYKNTETGMPMYNVTSHEGLSTTNKRKVTVVDPKQYELPFKPAGLQWMGNSSITARQLQKLATKKRQRKTSTTKEGAASTSTDLPTQSSQHLGAAEVSNVAKVAPL